MQGGIPEIVIDGGPCSGKTTGMSYFVGKLRDMGYRVFVVPEIATMLINPGIPDINKIARENSLLYFSIEREIFRVQQIFRERYMALAKEFSKETIILYDRGIMDVRAYLNEEEFMRLCREEQKSVIRLRDTYDGVIHLVTAAEGAESFYTLENNLARRETAEEARLADKKTRNAWNGHQQIFVIDNSTDFENKLKRAFASIMYILGKPISVQIQKKFILRSLPKFVEWAGAIQEIFIEQIYLVSSADSGEFRIRKRVQDGHATFFETIKKPIGSGKNIRTQRMINENEYLALSSLQNPQKHIIRKKRFCFFYNNQYFRLDEFMEPTHIFVLEIEATEENQIIEIPHDFEVIKEVTGDISYDNSVIAKRV